MRCAKFPSKTRYNKAEAREEAKFLNSINHMRGNHVKAYYCSSCKGYHIGKTALFKKSPGKNRRRL